MDPTSSPNPPPTEVELKLFVPPSSVARLWTHPLLTAHAIGPLRIARIDNRYFDTQDGALAAARMALRLRRTGRRWVQTLKHARPDDGALSTRGEWEMAVAGPALELARLKDTPLATLGSPRTLAARLQPVFTTNFRRESRLLRLKDGSEVEFAFDVGVVVSGRGRARRTLPICEVEIEAKSGTPDLLKFAARLVDDLPLIPLAASKAERGHRLQARRALEATKTSLPEPHPEDAARLHLARVLDACNRSLLENVHGLFETALAREPGAALDGEVEFVHQSRVAVRRMRSALRMFGTVTKDRRIDAVDTRLRTIGHALGEARDWDVFAGSTDARLDEVAGHDAEGRAALDAMRVEVAERRTEAHRALMARLDTGDFGATTLAVERLVQRLQDGRRGPTLEACVVDLLSAQRERLVRSARRIAVLDAEQRHGLRVEVKRLRYALDLLDALYEAATVEDFRDALTDLQDKLGKLNDAVVADGLMRSLPVGEGIDLVRARFSTWLAHHVQKQLPKVAALSVALELTRPPWLVRDAST